MPEYQLFILWERARYQQEKILADMREHFAIVKQYEMCWTPEIVSSNFTRFYGENLPSHSEKEQECGTGAFLLVVVLDENPRYEYRMTSHGRELVNAKMFDAKQRYRDWTGGGHKIHCSNSAAEFNHDITLLIGLNAEDFLRHISEQTTTDGGIESLSQDVVGANGWESLNQLLYVLNATVNYVVMRGEEWLTTGNACSEHGDVDILLTKRQSAIHILNGSFYCNPLHPHIQVMAAGKEYIFDLWECGQGAYDPYWERNMLAHRVLKNNYYALSDEDDFYCLLYHCLINKNKIPADYKVKLNQYKKQFAPGESDWSRVLADYLAAKSYVVMLENNADVDVHVDNQIIRTQVNRYGTLRKRLCEEVDGQLYLSAVYEKHDSFVKKGTPWLIDNEARFLKDLQDDSHFPHILAEGEDNGEKWIEISRINGCNVLEFFKSTHKHNTVRNVKAFVSEGIQILRVLRDKNIIHRDIMPRNILLSQSEGKLRVGIIDFGWSIYKTELSNTVTPFELGGKYALPDKSSDIYSFAVILKELWPHVQGVQNVVEQLRQGEALENITLHLTCRDCGTLFLIRHRILYRIVAKLYHKYKQHKRKYNPINH